MKILNLIPPVFLLAALAACSSEPERPDPPAGYFATHVAEDGTKQYQYTLEIPESRSNRGRPGNMTGHASGSSSRGVSGGVTAGSSGRGSSRGGGRERFDQINRELENRLEQELKDSGFCLTGHRETQRVVEPGTVYIRGECAEKATGNGNTEQSIDVTQQPK